MSQELKCKIILQPSTIWLLLCVTVHGVVLGVVLSWLTVLPLQLIYGVVIVVLCGYHCRVHWRRRPCWSYFTNGYIQLVADGELFPISKRSRSADLFIYLVFVTRDDPRCYQSLYIMRDAVADVDYRRLVRTIKILNHHF